MKHLTYVITAMCFLPLVPSAMATKFKVPVGILAQ